MRIKDYVILNQYTVQFTDFVRLSSFLVLCISISVIFVVYTIYDTSGNGIEEFFHLVQKSCKKREN